MQSMPENINKAGASLHFSYCQQTSQKDPKQQCVGPPSPSDLNL